MHSAGYFNPCAICYYGPKLIQSLQPSTCGPVQSYVLSTICPPKMVRRTKSAKGKAEVKQSLSLISEQDINVSIIDETPIHYAIGIGASAGGLEALSELFASLPNTLQQKASFLVAQHLSPTHRSMLVQILSKQSVLPVLEAEDACIIQPGIIYITPPDSDIQIIGWRIRLSKPRLLQGPKPSVDLLLRSLSAEYKERAIAIILSGTGSDGAQGITAIKAHQGIAIIQNPETAKYDGMPLAALQTGMIDYSIPPREMGKKLEEIIFSLPSLTDVASSNNEVVQIFELLNQRFGIDFSQYKSSTILRRIDKSIKKLQLATIKEYLEYCLKNPAELNQLLDSFLIGVTSFYRDPDAFRLLETYISNKITSLKHDTFRIWVPGCSTGEEAYSIGMLAQHIIDHSNNPHLSLQIFATDVNEHALEHARKAIYSEESIKSIPSDLLNKFMIKTDAGYEIDKKLRSRILFSRHDITINPPFLKIDLLSCRNVLIYLGSEIQRHVFPIFHYSLKDDGLLFLGKSESITMVEDLFDIIDARHKLFRKRKFSNNRSFKFNSFKPLELISRTGRSASEQSLHSYRGRITETVLDIAQPAYIIVNAAQDILETKGDLKNFITITEGILTTNISKMLRREIQIDIKNLIVRLIKENKVIKKPVKKITIDNKQIFLRLSGSPVIKEPGFESEDIYIIVFEQIDVEKDFAAFASAIPQEDNSRFLELEQELNITRQHLQTYIEEVETANEELQSLNEELQSSNEELQSTNEELETSNEELQSSNEELQTAYTEIKHINTELEGRDIQIQERNTLFETLFGNIQQGNILLDDKYQILLINQQARNLLQKIGIFNLPAHQSLIAFIPSGLAVDILEILNKCLKTGQMESDTIIFEYNEVAFHYELYATPVKNISQDRLQIALSIWDLTELRLREKEIFEKDEILTSLLESNSTYLIRTDMQGNYTYVNQAFCKKFGYTEEQVIGTYYAPTVHPDDLGICEKAVERVLGHPNEEVFSFEIRKPNPRGGYFDTEWEFVPIRNQEGEVISIQGVGRDITDKKVIFRALEAEKNHLELVLWAGRLGISSWDINAGTIDFNERWFEMLGYATTSKTIRYQEWLDSIHPDDQAEFEQKIHQCIIGNTAFFEIEYSIKTFNGQWLKLVSTGKVTEREPRGKALKILAIHQDITARKLMEKQNQELAMVARLTSNGVIITGVDRTIEWVNDAFTHITGYTLSEVKGKSPGSILQSKGTDLETVRMIREKLNALQPITCQIRNCGKDGREYWLQLDVQPIYDNNGQHRGFMAIQSDITQSKIFEQELLEYNSMLRLMGKLANVGTWIFDTDHQSITLSPELLSIFGYITNLDEELPIDLFFDRFIPAEEAIKVHSHCFSPESYLSTDNQYLRFTGITKDQDIRYYEVFTQKIGNKIIGSVVDITDNIYREKELIRMNETLEERVNERTAELLAMQQIRNNMLDLVAHDIKNMLTGILLQGQMLLKHNSSTLHNGNGINEKVHISGLRIVENAKEMMNLLQNMLESRKLDEGAFVPRMKECDLNLLILTLLKRFQERTIEKRIIINTNIETKVAFSDFDLLVEIIENILSNAVKYSHPDSVIEVGTYAEPNHCIVYVKDNGPGIKPDEMDKLFTRFSRLSAKPTGGEHSTGLGLSIAKQFAELLGGSIICESEFGHGALFKVALPLTEIDLLPPFTATDTQAD